jgi:hypothetical protein
MSDGIGDISYNSRNNGGGGGAPPGFINVAGAKNGLSVEAGGFIELGQHIGAIGNPAQLLNSREIPLNSLNLNLRYQDGAVLSFDDEFRGMLLIDPGTNVSGVPIGLITIQGRTPGVNPFGNFWHTLDQSFTNPDGQTDAVYQWGYNQNGVGGVVVANECEVHYAIESHFQQGGVGTGQMEVHLQSTAKNGDVNRHFSYDIQCANGETSGFSEVDSFNWLATLQAGLPTPYFSVQNDGTMTLFGSAIQFDLSNGADGVQLAADPGFGFSISVSNPNIISNGINFGSSIDIVPNNFVAVDIRSSNPSISTSNSIGVGWSGNKTANYQPFSTGPTGFDAGSFSILGNASSSAGAYSYLQIDAMKTGAGNIPLIGFINHLTGTGWTQGSPVDDSWKIQFNNSFNFLTGTAAISATAGNGVGINTNTADPSAVLDVTETTRGFLPPRMTTTQKNAIVAPAEGLIVYDLTLHKLALRTAAAWETVTSI